MNEIINVLNLIAWQETVIKAQKLVLTIPGTGINPDTLPTLPLNELSGIIAYLERLNVDRSN
ncbi:MAG: hypothetical protein ACPG62_10290 [Cycloclasticus sp.]